MAKEQATKQEPLEKQLWEAADKLRDNLLPKLMSGDVRVGG